jgi:hypothetical protein
MLHLQHVILIWLLVTWIIFLNSDMPALTWNALATLRVCVEHGTFTTLAAARRGLARFSVRVAGAYRTLQRLCSSKPCTEDPPPGAAATTSESTTSTNGCLNSCSGRPTSPNTTCSASRAHSVQTARQPLPKIVSERYSDL